MNTTKKIELKGLPLDELRIFLGEIGEQKFRGEQVFNWIHNHLIDDFDLMLNLPKDLRQKLKNLSTLESLQRKTVQQSMSTGTIKYLNSTKDGKHIESVLIPDNNRNTLCISTQVGCPLDCKFCATGLMGYKRNLSSAEIVDQYLISAKETGKDKITNIVYMGMGEPLLNFENTIKSLRVFIDEKNTGLSHNRITISTAGIAPKIIELADTGLRVKLALSLHSCFEDVRTRIMPINKKYSFKQNIEAVKYYAKQTKTRITFEYTMLNGINDRNEDINALIKLCKQIPSKINVIPFNSIKHMDPGGVSAELDPTPMPRIYEFVEKLRSNKITVMIRDTQGDDIAAACGQLAVKY
ncbi:MAG: 23S rRNA (adenine(2503)-C(2))-methyltransferase RlmN [Melioribacteraceae bacterium]|nr:23S rRNA (adenine(2503)-C(2))-methyltransferase RlmN [Melioribacteraceae bacterium]MCF8356209.1 23S rRNA (adenine(2503)-C(2))-methyltransferase RlmN [Melioribacteraceae bacterium]MCF8395862.1 23S rRNA (adenine(2503)-C(2))-methyltransferase RlmN [Melioribacteraceae bacterium]MCF8420044.1 23S rRNA (adenine(2503)-C(2))-methyltransferase RlmN [Melioribacteraceae bacterium]